MDDSVQKAIGLTIDGALSLILTVAKNAVRWTDRLLMDRSLYGMVTHKIEKEDITVGVDGLEIISSYMTYM